MLFIAKIPVYVFQPHLGLSACLCAESVTQLANGFFSPIMHCRAPLVQIFFFLFFKRIIGCSVLRDFFLIVLQISEILFPIVY
jgi:hypothetical protein